MKKLIYVLKRIVSLDYGKLFQTVKEIHTESGKSRIFLFFDIIYCGFRYGAGYTDYKWFHFHELPDRLRSTYITRTKNNQIVRQLNDPAYYHLINNKIEFLKLFKDFIHRDWLYLDECSYEDFVAFCEKHDSMMVKPIDETGGLGVEKLFVKDFASIEALYRYIQEKHVPLVEECIIQHPSLSEMYPYAVNTYRIMSIRDGDHVDIILAYIRIGNRGAVVDNHHSGGMSSPVDIESGEILYPALDIDGNLFEEHPMTHMKMVGFKLPYWRQALDMVREAGMLIPQLRYIGWDVAITKDGPLLVEGNHIPGYDIMQLPGQNPDRVGFLPIYRKYVKGI